MDLLDRAWDSLKREIETACSLEARKACELNTSHLNQSLRRLRHYQSESEWVTVLADSASMFASALAVFEVQGKNLKLRAERGLNLSPGLSMKMPPAILTAVETKDPVVALRSASEVGQELCLAGGRAQLIPISNGERVAALLFAEDDGADPNALELIAGIASAVLERKTNAALHAQIGVVDAKDSRTNRSLPAWADLTEGEQTAHLRAQRFSRVAVAEAQLARPEACAAGREAKDIYLFLKPEIEKAREAYRRQFMMIGSMVDYLHLELVRVIADNDENAMGVEYPGALV